MSYARYRGRTQGRLLHALSVYAKGYYDICKLSQVGDGRVNLGDHLVACYQWVDEDTPSFSFYDFDPLRPQIGKSLNAYQFFRQPFLDDPLLLLNLDFMIQEVRRSMTLAQAIEARYARDVVDQNWEIINEEWGEVVRAKIVACSGQTFSKELAVIHWKHIALCAIYGI